MIRRAATAFVAVLALLILLAEVQRADDAAADQFKQSRRAGVHQN